ncbi:MAG: hypothetical protein KC503_12170 [Myxococcales bacterium]|nr:hypothetical protein [Myxococcales bacterium]
MRAIAALGVAVSVAACTFSTDGVYVAPSSDKTGGVPEAGIDRGTGVPVPPSEAGVDQTPPGPDAPPPSPDLPVILTDSSVDSTADSSSLLANGVVCFVDQQCSSGHCVKSAFANFLKICCVSDCKPKGWTEGCQPGGGHCESD